MASIWEKAISVLAGNVNSGRSYLITAAVQKKHFCTNLQNWLISILVSFADLNCSWKLMSLNPTILHPNLLFLSNRKRMRFSRTSLHRKWMQFWARSHFHYRMTYRSVMQMRIFSSLSLMTEILQKKGLKNIINQILLLTAFGNGFTNNDFRIFTKLFIFIFRLFCQNKPNSFWYLGIAF